MVTFKDKTLAIAFSHTHFVSYIRESGLLPSPDVVVLEWVESGKKYPDGLLRQSKFNQESLIKRFILFEKKKIVFCIMRLIGTLNTLSFYKVSVCI